MFNIVFVCLGNICRSPMAESVMTYLINQDAELQSKVAVQSRATSTEETGNPPHRGTVAKLREQNIPLVPHRAEQLVKSDYEKFDLIIGMENSNYDNIMRIVRDDPQNKVYNLLDFTSSPRDIADPWYTDNFDQTFADIWEGCTALVQYLKDMLPLYQLDN